MLPSFKDALMMSARVVAGLVAGLMLYIASLWFSVGEPGGNAAGFVGVTAAFLVAIAVGVAFYWLGLVRDLRRRRRQSQPLGLEDSDVRTFMRSLWSRPLVSDRRPWGRRARPRRRA